MPRFDPKLIFAAATILSLTLAASVRFDRRQPETMARPFRAIPYSLAGWSYTEDAVLPPNTLKHLAPTDSLSRVYIKKSCQLSLFAAFYAEQRTGESIHSPKHCLPGSGWEIWRYGSATMLVDGRPETINRYSIEKRGTRKVVLYWYQSKDRIIASEYAGKLQLMKDALWSGRTAGALVRIVLPDDEDAIQEGLAFATAVTPEVAKSFSSTLSVDR